MHFRDLGPDVLSRVLSTIHQHEPGTTALLVHGSYALGTATDSSDLDLQSITSLPSEPYRTWFEPRDDAPRLHVSLGACSAEAWLAGAKEPAGWALGFPAVTTAEHVWGYAAGQAGLGADPSRQHPAAAPELEDFVEAVMKTRGALAAGDELGVRWAAQQAGRLAPSLLIPLNPEWSVHNRREALDAALGLTVVPHGYRDQLLICLGLTTVTAPEVAEATATLGGRMLAFLRERNPTVDPQPWLTLYLRDGTLEKHLVT